MVQNTEKLSKAREVLCQIAEGINPLNGKNIGEKDFVHDPEIIRCFFYLSEVLKDVIDGRNTVYRNKPSSFCISEDEKGMVRLKEGKIGVNEFSRCVNMVIDPDNSKKLTGVELNRQLKKMGVLGELKDENGKTRTFTNEKSGDYGIETETRNFKGLDYEAVVFNEQGKRFLLDNLERIMGF